MGKLSFDAVLVEKFPDRWTEMSSERDLSDIRRYLEKGDYNDAFTKAQKREVRRRAAKFFIGDGVLFYRDACGEARRVVEQDSERIRILKACHEGLGVSKLWNRVPILNM